MEISRKISDPLPKLQITFKGQYKIEPGAINSLKTSPEYSRVGVYEKCML